MKEPLILLLKYIAHVGNMEGTDFLSEKLYEDNFFSEDEKAILNTLSDAGNTSEAQAILNNKGMSAEEKNVALANWLFNTIMNQLKEPLILLLKYIEHVRNIEGTDFLSPRYFVHNFFSLDQEVILDTLSDACNTREAQAILNNKGMSAEEKNVALANWLFNDWRCQDLVFSQSL